MKQYLDYSQIQRLIELGVNVDCGSNSVYRDYSDNDILISRNSNSDYVELYPTLTIGELIDKLPMFIECEGDRYVLNISSYVCYAPYEDDSLDYLLSVCSNVELIDNLFNLYVLCIMNGYIII